MSDQKQEGLDDSGLQYPPRELLGGKLGYVAIAISIAIAIAFTIYVVVQGLGGGILFLVWIVIGGFAALFLARRLTQRPHR
jgi:hypothetical protein